MLQVVDEELDRIPAEFKDPRFDSLRHVLNILSAVDAEAALEEVRHSAAHVGMTALTMSGAQD